ncbi:MAG TPA: ATP-binding protein [Prosthecobacter sp.]|nr:ATP-binding protein [Prosthecobacter sp.]HRK13724.1 ATP-binding protein [Prosthecobacter sp.]
MAAISSLAPASAPLDFSVARKAAPAQAAAKPVKAEMEAVFRQAEKSERFEAEIRELNLRNARLGAWFVMILVPFCSVLDWLAYPQRFWEFLVLRIACSALCVPLLLALDRPWAGRYHRVYPVILPLLPALAICLMIYFTRDGASPYYAGLMLCLVGTSFVFHWTFREIGLTVALVLAFYLAATLPNLSLTSDQRSMGLFINNSIFILLTCVVLYFGSRQHHAIRVREFVNRCKVEAQREELSRRNEELTDTLRRLRETEAQLTQSEKLASIGRLSAGIVHEINNPLNFVKSAVFLLKKKTAQMPPELAGTVTTVLNDIGEGVGRVSDIVSDLRTFAHPEARAAARPVNLAAAAARAARFMAKAFGDKGARLHCAVPDDLTALGDENHLIQILINLMQNGLDAQGAGAFVEVSAAPAAGSRLELRVRDGGKGIPQEHLARVFDPFFTTKEVGQGMGLGLSLCYRMMQGMGGDIRVTSRPGDTCFILNLPCAAPAQS